ncbi:Esa1p-associated factor [Coniosporium apollinis]|uniref:Chromatin modification-related protein EAF3 n=1 Tax=Coniosporium apollinis TaxID=61459 RepID=A0ABQ9NPP7_9PEZI|nr:Esa1p-associated factor [Coniosporium apollinis]
MPSAFSPMFSKDEKALCFHHELLYEAKILDVRQKEADDKKSGFEYKVHYKGWKNTWDDWVPQDRLRKNTEENRELARNLKHDMDALRNLSTKKPSSTSHKKKADFASSARDSEERHSSIAVAAGPRGQKRGRDYQVESEETFLARPSVRIVMPDRLKSLLVDDWENITKNLQLVTLPSKSPTSLILDEYAAEEKAKRREGSADWDILEEVVAGVKEYFNKCLSRMLLYRFEREQFYQFYHQIEEDPTGDLAGKAYADIYGGEHLLRLFVSMPELIAQTNMDQQSVNRLREELSKMTMWLARDASVSRYFSVEYENSSTEYQEKSKGTLPED